MGYRQWFLLVGGDKADGGFRGILTASDPEEDNENIRKGVRWFRDTH
jgi:hypothetical protein